jgi:hypothetical protein
MCRLSSQAATMPMTSMTRPTAIFRRRNTDARSSSVSYGIEAITRSGVR